MASFCSYHVPLFLLRLLFSSDDFIQAQQQLARWASEDVVSVVVLDQPPSGTMSDSQPYIDVGPISGAITQQQHPQQQQQHQHHGDHHQSSAAASASAAGAATAVANNSIMALPIVPNGISVSQRDYYPSPPSTETESSGSVIQPPIRRGLPLAAADTAALSQQHQQQLQLLQLPIYQQQQHQHQQHPHYNRILMKKQIYVGYIHILRYFRNLLDICTPFK